MKEAYLFNSFVTEFQSKSVDWFLYDWDLHLERVKTLPNIYDETFILKLLTTFIFTKLSIVDFRSQINLSVVLMHNLMHSVPKWSDKR